MTAPRSNPQPPPPPARNRRLYAGIALVVAGIGLQWRSGILPLPPWLASSGGDALWALLVFLCFALAMPAASTLRLALLALAFSWGIEFSQLCQAPWIDSLRDTLLGKLVLGNTFHWPDFPAYTTGIALGAIAEWRCRRPVARMAPESDICR